MKKMFILLFAICLSGCIGTVPIKPEQRANLHKVAVVSLLGGDLRFTKVGFTVFNNDEFIKGSTTWNLDNEVQKNIVEVLRQTSPDLQVVPVPFDRSELFKIYKSSQSWGEYQSLDRIEPELKRKMAESPVDAVILIHKIRVEDPVAFTSVYLEGYGVYYRSLPFVDPFIKPYALFRIVVLDGKSLKPISDKYVRGISNSYGKSQISWDDQLKNNLSDQLISDFRSAIEVVVKNNVQIGLKEIGF